MGEVPCNGCRACCKGQRVNLHPELGDDIDTYMILPTRAGNDGPIGWMLAHKQNGDCWYLTSKGCSIHGRAPHECREFDCRKWYAGFGWPERMMLLNSPLDRECAVAAKERLDDS